jgi:hypothetical protein
MDEKLTSNQMLTNKKLTGKEEGQMIRARAFLNRLDNKVQEKDEIVKQIRYIVLEYILYTFIFLC